MKKLILLSFFILFSVRSCSSTINRPLYSKTDNAKELILSKYGKPSNVENQLKKEIWHYNNSNQFKIDRTVVFDNPSKIIENKKHYKTFHMITGLNKHGYIAVGTILILYAISGPFPALL